ncbi:hypothetical protein BDQ12DRAFT_646138 [Crucibulum laeve]|uniref:F-box domain-containing protein n=1 Tax=Crucibulum laeve TaxID=68775 RepID=A0A5C3M889_9AGAR|nr:hypothetical protein BDQ12DRAFT_646138 [Crucibulum laeve]
MCDDRNESLNPLPTRLTSRIAPEIYDQILAKLYSSKSALSASSLVCRSWLPVCRFHLFSDVTLSSAFFDFLVSSPHAMLTVTRYIRNATFRGSWCATITTPSAKSLLVHLESLVQLRLETWSWDGRGWLGVAMFAIPKGQFAKQLTTLDLRRVHFSSFAVFTHFIGGFFMLKDLGLDNVSWDHEMGKFRRSSLSPATPVFQQLKKLCIKSCLYTPILSWLSSLSPGFSEAVTDHVPSTRIPLEELSLPDILPGEVGFIGRFLRSLGPSLNHLEIGFLMYGSDVSTARDILGAVDLSLNANLRIICIHQVVLYQFPFSAPSPSASHFVTMNTDILPFMMFNSPYAWIFALLSTVGSSSITQVTFHMWLSTESQLDVIDWQCLNRILSKSAFRNLQDICFSISGIGEVGVEQWLRRRLWNLHAAKITVNIPFLE